MFTDIYGLPASIEKNWTQNILSKCGLLITVKVKVREANQFSQTWNQWRLKELTENIVEIVCTILRLIPVFKI